MHGSALRARPARARCTSIGPGCTSGARRRAGGDASVSAAAPRQWLDAARRDGVDTAAALAVFDALGPVTLEAMSGRWDGVGLRSGHPLDGMLEAFGWRGKHFGDAGAAHPLLFADARSGTVAIDPKRLPIRLATRLRVQRWPGARGAFVLAQPLLRTARPAARLGLVEYRGCTTAAMRYDAVPILDVFRRIDDDCVLGLMDCRYFDAPFFFALVRGRPGAPAHAIG